MRLVSCGEIQLCAWKEGRRVGRAEKLVRKGREAKNLPVIARSRVRLSRLAELITSDS